MQQEKENKKMKNKEEIINDSIKLELPPKNYDLLETHCFWALKQLLIMYHNGMISKEKATLEKQHILARYEQDVKQYDFERSVYQEHIQHIKDTEMLKTQLRKRLNDNDPVTEEKLAECLNLAMSVLSIVFRGEF